MRTLLLSPELFLAEGGIARIMRVYLKALCAGAAPGDCIESLVLNDGPAADARLPRYAGPALQANRGCQRRKPAFFRQVLRLGWRSDRIICGHLHLLPLVLFVKLLRPRLAYYLVAHGIEVWRPYSVMESAALRRARGIFCVSEYTRRQMLRFCPGLDPAKLTVLPNTLDPYLASGQDTAPSRTIAGPVILSVARLTAADSYKGIDVLIEALPLILRQLPLAQLRIVGGGDDLPRLRDLAAQLRVTSSVHFAGQIDDQALRAEYAGCDLFALPSRREGFGLVYLEAMTCGKPCLAARAGGAPEVVDDSVGALAEYGNIPETAAAVLDLVRHPRDPEAIRRHADTFAFPAFCARLSAALA